MGEARYGSDEARGASELRKQRMTNDAATNVAKWTTSTFLTTLGIAALSVAIAVAPAEAKKQKSPADAHISDLDSGDPLFLVVSTGSQKVDIYRGTQLVVTSQVSTGMPAHPTFLGAFSILEKQRWHHSNIYSGAPMPWMNRITWSGTALHAGIVPGYPASHGCIRLPYSFAPKLYDITSVGDNVVISRDRPAPALIEHPNLFQPLPPPAMVKQEQTKQKQSTNDLLILAAGCRSSAQGEAGQGRDPRRHHRRSFRGSWNRRHEPRDPPAEGAGRRAERAGSACTSGEHRRGERS